MSVYDQQGHFWMFINKKGYCERTFAVAIIPMGVVVSYITDSVALSYGSVEQSETTRAHAPAVWFYITLRSP